MNANTRRDNDDNDRSGRGGGTGGRSSRDPRRHGGRGKVTFDKKFMGQEKVRSVLLTLLLICHATAASLILTAHTDSALSPCDHPPLTSPH